MSDFGQMLTDVAWFEALYNKLTSVHICSVPDRNLWCWNKTVFVFQPSHI